jgi:hypothetical protein
MIVVLTFVGCEDNVSTLPNSTVGSIITGDYGDNFSPLAISNLESCKEFYKFTIPEDYKYEILNNKDYYIIIVTDTSTMEFKCILNVWYDNKNDYIENVAIEFSNEIINTATTLAEGLEYEDGFVLGSNNLIFEEELNEQKNTVTNSKINIDDLIPDFSQVETYENGETVEQTFKPREELDGKELLTREPSVTDPSISFVYE